MGPRRAAAALVALVGLALAANVAADRSARSWDLTAEGSAHLSKETLRVLRRVDRRIDITAFFSRRAMGRVEAATMLAQYRKANRRITFRILDPALAPGEARRFGITDEGSAAVEDLAHPGKVEIAQYVIEIDLTSAIARILRGKLGTVCFSTGHGERAIDDEDPSGLSEAAKILRANGYSTRTVDLLARPSVPPACRALVVAAPDADLGRLAEAAIRSYLAPNGKAFVLADPGTARDPLTVDLTPVVRPWGIRFVRGIVAEGDADSHLPGDVTAPIVRRYSAASPPMRGLGPTFLPGAMEVDARNMKDPGLSVGEVAMTSPLAYLDRADPSTFDPEVDRKGPVPVAVAADDSEVRHAGRPDAEILRTRILAIGDVDFATNRFIEEASNAKLVIQTVDWLTQPEDLVTAVPNFPKLRELELTEARSRYILMLMAGIVPGLFLVAGGLVWVLRRGR